VRRAPVEEAELTKVVASSERLAHDDAGLARALDYLLHLAAVNDEKGVALVALATAQIRSGLGTVGCIVKRVLYLPIDKLAIVYKYRRQAFHQHGDLGVSENTEQRDAQDGLLYFGILHSFV
jgi:hypothetical protein